MSHNTLLVFEVTILVLAIFLGFEVISKVPSMLHTPLMSGTNAIHGIVIVGAMIVLGLPHKSAFTWIVGFAAVVLASANVAAIATTMPAAPIQTPRRACAGFERSRSAQMKVTIVTR